MSERSELISQLSAAEPHDAYSQFGAPASPSAPDRSARSEAAA
jgi:hypothetical protein